MSGFFNSRDKQTGKPDDSDLTPRSEAATAPDSKEATARFMDETYHLANHPFLDDVQPDEQAKSRPRQRRRKQPGPRRFGVQLPDDGKKPWPLKRAAIPIEDILARRGRQGGYTAGPGGPTVKIIADPYGHGSNIVGVNSLPDDAAVNSSEANEATSGTNTNVETSLEDLREAAPANDANVPAPSTSQQPDDTFDFLDSLDRTQGHDQTGDLFDVSRVGSSGNAESTIGPLQSPEAEYAALRKRRRLAGVAVLLLGTGVVMSALAYLGGPSTILQQLTGTGAGSETSIDVNSTTGGSFAETSGAESDVGESVFVQVDPEAGLALRQRRNDALSEISGLIESGNLQEAQIQLDNLDLVVYGYGQQEFDVLLERIEGILQGNVQQNDQLLAAADTEADGQITQSDQQVSSDPSGSLDETDIKTESELQAQAQVEAELQTFSAETARLREEARLIAQETRLAREQAGQEREQQQAELARVLNEQREAEQAQVAQIEQQRELAQAARIEEELRLQEVREQLQLERQRAEAALREIEQRRIAEEARLAEAAAELEQQRLAQRQALEEEAEAAEARRLAELQRQQEDQRLAEEAAQQQAAEQARIEAERLAAEQQLAAQEQAEAARVAELQRQQEAQLLARQQALEEQRLQEEREAAEQALADEQARLAELQREEAELLAQRRAEQQERFRQERLAAEQAAAERAAAEQAEADRVAAEQAELQRQRQEQLLAQQQAEELERQRIEQQAIALARAEEAAQRAELQRQEEARIQAQQEAEDLEQRRKLELATRLAEQRRQEESEQKVAEAARLAAERRAEQQAQADVAEQVRVEREAVERRAAQQAEQARLERQATIARQRERLRASAAEQQRRANEVDTQDSDAELVAIEPEPVRNQPISDVDIARVYRQFQALEQAIEAKDMDRVLTITQQSGSKVGLFLQLFQNFDELDVRIENVSSQPARGVIQGKLNLRSVVRNGVRSAPPAVYPGSTSISSRRNSSGQWSKIVW